MVLQNTYVRCNPFRLSSYNDRAIHSETGACYVLVGNPPAAMTTSRLPERLWISISIESLRGRILQIKLPPKLTMQQHWGCFDMEHSVFLAHQGDTTDCAGMTFTFLESDYTGALRSRLSRPRYPKKFECVVYVVGWTRAPERIEYTIINRHDHRDAVHEVGTEFTQWINWRRLAIMLVASRIPKSDAVAIKLSGLEGHRAYVRLVVPEYPLEKLHVQCEVMKDEHVPAVKENYAWTL